MRHHRFGRRLLPEPPRRSAPTPSSSRFRYGHPPLRRRDARQASQQNREAGERTPPAAPRAMARRQVHHRPASVSHRNRTRTGMTAMVTATPPHMKPTAQAWRRAIRVRSRPAWRAPRVRGLVGFLWAAREAWTASTVECRAVGQDLTKTSSPEENSLPPAETQRHKRPPIRAAARRLSGCGVRVPP
jgi:hypothetical protein